jgi:hypothetical protein
MNVGFFVRHFTERGTEIAIYDYAHYNETILNNKSIIICFTERKMRELNFPTTRHSFEKFNTRFPIIEIGDIQEMKTIIEKYHLSFFYTLTYGGKNDCYDFKNKELWGGCKTIKHCVFYLNDPEGDFYIGIADFLNKKCQTNYPIIEHIVEFHETDENLRKELMIPENAIVLGRHGGMDEFNIPMTHAAIREYVQNNDDIYFLFMNTTRFYHHPRIIHLDRSVDKTYKAKFINTCDAMIHAREMGEIFPMSIAEFSIKNKPVITSPTGETGHIDILGEKAIIYTSKEELLDVFKNIKIKINSRQDWNAHQLYTPEYIMNKFKYLIFDNLNNQ